MILEKNISNGLDFCECPVLRKHVPMLTTDFQDPGSYPVEVFDINLVSIGFANNKNEYITIWNSSVDNVTVGYLIGDYGLFNFILVKNHGPLPDEVFGNPITPVTFGDFNDDLDDFFN